MEISQKGINLIKTFETFKSDAYICPAGKLTIGYGHTEGVTKGQKVTKAEAEKLLQKDLTSAENAVNKMFKEGLPQNKFDALVSFAFNVGNGAFFSSNLCNKVQTNPNDTEIRTEFEKWTKAKGQVLQGLVKRRKAEADLYFETK